MTNCGKRKSNTNKTGIFSEHFIVHHPYISYGMMVFVAPTVVLIAVVVITSAIAFLFGWL